MFHFRKSVGHCLRRKLSCLASHHRALSTATTKLYAYSSTCTSPSSNPTTFSLFLGIDNTRFHSTLTTTTTTTTTAPLFSSARTLATTPPPTTTNLYLTLGLNPTTSNTPEMIKRAYFERAKQTHPDLHPGDAESKHKFQQVNHAFQVLSNPQTKAEYDRVGDSGTHDTGSGDFDAGVAWQDVWQEYGFDHYISQVKDQAFNAVEDIRYRNDWVLAHEFAKEHKFLLLGVFVPLALGLRYPPLIIGGLRMAFGIAWYGYMYLPPRQKRMLMLRIWELLKSGSRIKNR